MMWNPLVAAVKIVWKRQPERPDVGCKPAAVPLRSTAENWTASPMAPNAWLAPPRPGLAPDVTDDRVASQRPTCGLFEHDLVDLRNHRLSGFITLEFDLEAAIRLASTPATSVS